MSEKQEDKPEAFPEIRELIDAAMLACIFKIESKDELTVQLPKKAMTNIEMALRRVHPTFWEQIESQRKDYLKYIDKNEEKANVKPSLLGKMFHRKKKTG